MGQDGLIAQVSKNEVGNHTGTIVAAALMGCLAYFYKPVAVFYIAIASASGALLSVLAIREESISHDMARGGLSTAGSKESTMADANAGADAVQQWRKLPAARATKQVPPCSVTPIAAVSATDQEGEQERYEEEEEGIGLLRQIQLRKRDEAREAAIELGEQGEAGSEIELQEDEEKHQEPPRPPPTVAVVNERAAALAAAAVTTINGYQSDNMDSLVSSTPAPSSSSSLSSTLSSSASSSSSSSPPSPPPPSSSYLDLLRDRRIRIFMAWY